MIKCRYKKICKIKSPLDNLQIKGGGMMTKVGEVQPEGCICEPCSDISGDMRNKFRYNRIAEKPRIIKFLNNE